MRLKKAPGNVEQDIHGLSSHTIQAMGDIHYLQATEHLVVAIIILHFQPFTLYVYSNKCTFHCK